MTSTALGGCLGTEDDTDPTTREDDNQTAGNDSTGDSPDEPSDPDTGTQSDDLDLREANVTDVSITNDGDTTYRFDVELYHDDDGEAGYANWWQVETRSGDSLGRRELTHPHGTRRFTRSESIDVPADIDCVVVRGHDQTHGDGGQAMLVSIPDGTTSRHQQGNEPMAFDATDAPECS